MNSCSEKKTGIQLNIAVSANAYAPLQEIAGLYEKEYGGNIHLSVGSSGKLATQIRQGAPFHVFISADQDIPDQLYEEGLTIGAPKIYAIGKLILWSNMLDSLPELHTLKLASNDKFAIANPRHAPYGIGAKEVLQTYALWDHWQKYLIIGESISQTNQFILSGGAVAGITSLSTVKNGDLSDIGTWQLIDPATYNPILQAAVLLSSDSELLPYSEQFFQFLFSEKSRYIFEEYGYDYPENNSQHNKY